MNQEKPYNIKDCSETNNGGGAGGSFGQIWEKNCMFSIYFNVLKLV